MFAQLELDGSIGISKRVPFILSIKNYIIPYGAGCLNRTIDLRLLLSQKIIKLVFVEVTGLQLGVNKSTNTQRYNNTKFAFRASSE